MPALVAVMIMVSIGTFSWASFKNMKLHPKSSSIVMIATVLVVVLTHNLALGVGVGVLLSALFFARKVAHFLHVSSDLDESGSRRTYTVVGQLFFASADGFVRAFDFKESVPKIQLDITHAHFWDLTAVASLDKVVLKFRREAKEVEVLGLNAASATLVDRLGTHDKLDAMDDILTH
jgi:SulP family sulfate permease